MPTEEFTNVLSTSMIPSTTIFFNAHADFSRFKFAVFVQYLQRFAQGDL